MRQTLQWVKRNALNITLLLLALAAGAGVYALILVQNERAQTILRACRQQNDRHAATVSELDSLLAKAKQHASPARLKQIRENRASTVLLIDALAPYQNCQRVLAQATSNTPSAAHVAHTHPKR